jgi:hypothetical protein
MPLTVTRTYGAGGVRGPVLLDPQEAVAGPHGLIYVADTGHHRIAILNSAGLVGAITQGPSGPLLAPYSLAIQGSSLYVLDSDLGRVLEYTLGGGQPRLQRASPVSLPLMHARGLALDAAGNVLVADPAGNAVLELRPDLTLLRSQPALSAGGTELFDQPSAVAAGPGGSIYVVDSQRDAVRLYDPSWSVLRSWSIAPGDTLHSARILPLTDGRLVVSDPRDGKLLLYAALSSTPQVYTVPVAGGIPPVPLGVALGPAGNLLVTCDGSGTVLQVVLPAGS